jgi:hypothetical protein
MLRWLMSVPGSDANTQGAAGSTPLHAAVGGGHIECVDFLIWAMNVDTNVSGRTRRGDLTL